MKKWESVRRWISKNWYWVLGVASTKLLAWIVFETYQANNLGFNKTLWDWMDLLIIPFALAVFGFWTNFVQNKRDREIAAQVRETDREIAEKEREADREIAEKERETDREIARDRQRQNTLDRYFDKMGDFFGEGVFDNEADGPLKSKLKLAKSITVVTIGDLDADRNGQLLRFLQESDLIKTGAIEFENVDLRQADLSEANLSEANLKGAKLTDADLRGANLLGANLLGAKLIEADLRLANLSGCDLSGTMLIEAVLMGTKLIDANLSGAKLINANLRGADLSGAKLIEADLLEADLSRAKLIEANLFGANLLGADLSVAIFDDSTIMPDGSKWHKNYFSYQTSGAQD
ncbi:MAG: pentapeptide repeat-containing protein [Chloroflexota bacterium]